MERTDRTAIRRRVAILPAIGLITAGLWASAGAPAQDLQSRIDQNRQRLEQKRSQLQQAHERAGVLSRTIETLDKRVEDLNGEVATLANRLELVRTQLRRTEARLERAKDRLQVLRARLHRSLKVLRERLVAVYQSNAPDALTVILNAHGFDDMLDRYQYLGAIQDQDSQILGRVTDLRDRAVETVHTIRAARDRIAGKQQELEQTQAALEERRAQLADAQAEQQAALRETHQHEAALEGDLSGIQDQITSQLQALAAQQAASAPAGPVEGQPATGPVSSSGFIWPVNGPITSPFCEQRPWESCHPGIDIAVPSGTPIHAAAAGTVVIAGPESGYGNYTCIDHGGGLSTCYAHQESFAVSVGQHVSQGQVIGYSDCTGLCFGPHLHFEVRVNGEPVDPMGYL